MNMLVQSCLLIIKLKTGTHQRVSPAPSVGFSVGLGDGLDVGLLDGEPVVGVLVG